MCILKNSFLIKMNKNLRITIILISVAVIVVVFGFWYAGQMYDQGYETAIADIKAQQEEVANRAAQAAADEANPFKVENPLQGVEANPFEKAKKTLNPFD